ncbi:MAG: THUMP domain-containing protein [Candidatus Jordarchaeum sp.]|uniref:THUMP domain-containing protein n=1 Tax=Candidatus Jordarchaeum sp. TaxID=2823881 RepID=UPI00404A6413
MENPSLFVTYDMKNKRESKEEVLWVLGKVGEQEPIFLSSRARGIFLIQTSLDPKEVTKKLTQLCKEQPDLFWYTYNYIPIDVWCSSELDEMEENVIKLAEGIKQDETWRITVNKRFYGKYHTIDIIEALAENISWGKVDLENPQKIIQIEIIGKQAAISLLEPSDIFSVSKVKSEI